jgi:E3 ubiquitin-protein ligase DOA10
MDIDGAPLCRVCRSDDPTLGPLFHPCRCTGSIAHVHQDCLSTWLSHSKKSSCELCGHLFSFEKVYKPGSPDRPPFTTITCQALKEIALFLLLLSRAILVGLCWLAIVPWTVVWVSSAYWKAADWFAFGLTSNIDQCVYVLICYYEPLIEQTWNRSQD